MRTLPYAIKWADGYGRRLDQPARHSPVVLRASAIHGPSGDTLWSLTVHAPEDGAPDLSAALAVALNAYRDRYGHEALCRPSPFSRDRTPSIDVLVDPPAVLVERALAR